MTDVKNGIENTISGPAITFRVDPVVAARAGFTPQEIELDASAIFQGEPATAPVVIQRPALHDCASRFPGEHGASLDAIRNTMLVSSTRKDRHARLAGRLSRRNPARRRSAARICSAMVAVTGRLEGVSLGDGHRPRAESSGRIAFAALDSRGVRRPVPGTAAVISRSAVRSRGWPSCSSSRCCLFEFGGFAAPIAILSSALLSTSGVFFALLVTGTTFNIASFMGLIMVIGIVAKNGILLLDADSEIPRRRVELPGTP